jgi:hypothetical protein
VRFRFAAAAAFLTFRPRAAAFCAAVIQLLFGSGIGRGLQRQQRRHPALQDFGVSSVEGFAMPSWARVYRRRGRDLESYAHPWLKFVIALRRRSSSISRAKTCPHVGTNISCREAATNLSQG